MNKDNKKNTMQRHKHKLLQHPNWLWSKMQKLSLGTPPEIQQDALSHPLSREA
jgi:hypothetical protein